MNKKIFTALVSISILVSCSSNSEETNINPPNLLDVTTLSENSSQIYTQSDILNNGESIVEINLTEELGLPFVYQYLSFQNETLSFFNPTIDNYSVYEKNIINGSKIVVESICNPVDQFSKGANRSENKFILLTRDFPQNYVYIMDKLANECIQVDLGTGLPDSSISTTLVDNEILYIYLYIENDEVKIIRLDLNTGEITNELVLANRPKVTLIGGLLYSHALDGSYTSYDKETLELAANGNFQTQLLFLGIGAALSQIENSGNNIFINYDLPQPSPFVSSPAIIDITSGEIIKGGSFEFMSNLRDNLVNEIGTSVNFWIYDVDIDSESIVIAYQELSSGNVSLLFTNFNTEILKIVPLKALPSAIFIR